MRKVVVRWLLSSCLALITVQARSADPNAVLLRVGQRSVSLSEVEQRWRMLPAFQRRALGSSTTARLRAFIDQLVVPELLMLQAASRFKDVSSPRWQALEKAVLQQTLVEQLRVQSDAASPVTSSDVRAYFDSHRSQFDSPERLRLFRILVGNEKDAWELIHQLKDIPEFDAWRRLAREKSLDRATYMRGGELGFVASNGTTDMPELQVNPALFVVASRLNDGEIAKKPVPESDKFAVVWRRGHLPAKLANRAALESVIREHLRQERAQALLESLLSKLKNQYLKDLKPELLEGVRFRSRFENSPSDAGAGVVDGG